jgi:hypothetical protein
MKTYMTIGATRELKELSQIEAAWLAGIIEGEGSIRIEPKNGVVVRLSMTDEDVVRKVSAMCGAGNFFPLKPHAAWKAHYKPQFRWELGRREDVVPFLQAILPHLGSRRGARVREALSMPLPARMRTHCEKGHPLIPARGRGRRCDCTRGADRARKQRSLAKVAA